MAVGRWEAPASGTTLPSSRILAGANRQLKAKIITVLILKKLLFYFSFFPPPFQALFTLQEMKLMLCVCVCQSLLFQPGPTGAAKILQLPPVFCKQLARRWAALIMLFLREMPKHTLTWTPQNQKISLISRQDTHGENKLCWFFFCLGVPWGK